MRECEATECESRDDAEWRGIEAQKTELEYWDIPWTVAEAGRLLQVNEVGARSTARFNKDAKSEITRA